MSATKPSKSVSPPLKVCTEPRVSEAEGPGSGPGRDERVEGEGEIDTEVNSECGILG